MTSAEEFTEFATGNGRTRHVVNEWAGTVTPISTATGTAGRPIPGDPLRPRRAGDRALTRETVRYRCQP